MFIDRALIQIRSGKGGDGAVAFRREKYVSHGGPWGGDGGKGGDVILEASADMQTLLDFQFRREFVAEFGANGAGKNQTGKSGADRVVLVPCGTVVFDADTGEVLADLLEPAQRVVVAPGGRGGRGNASFASPTNRAPTNYEPGEAAIERKLKLELKLLADVGLVGLPNAGKSTLISAVSAARPKIADYPFTTLEPNLGVVRFGPGEHLVLADIPGLIEGAHAGAGLGHEFLRHVERTRLLLHVLDLSGGFEERDPIEDWNLIETELSRYSEDLARRARVAVLNKTDLPEARARLEEVSRTLKAQGLEVFAISAATRDGLEPLLDYLRRTVPGLPIPEPARPTVAPQPAAEPAPAFTIRRENGVFVVTGSGLDRLLTGVELGNAQALSRLDRQLTRLGIYQQLRERGVKDGDVVRVGPMEFTFVE